MSHIPRAGSSLPAAAQEADAFRNSLLHGRFQVAGGDAGPPVQNERHGNHPSDPIEQGEVQSFSFRSRDVDVDIAYADGEGVRPAFFDQPRGLIRIGRRAAALSNITFIGSDGTSFSLSLHGLHFPWRLGVR
jgi:hypothetical protein